MSKLRVPTIEPEGATTNLDLGGSGDSVAFNSEAIKANTFKDAGGNTLWTSDGSGTLSSINSSLAGGGMTVLNTQTITSNVATVEITANIDSTYKQYWVVGINIHPATTGTSLGFNIGASYNLTYRGTGWRSRHLDSGVGTYNFINSFSEWDGTTIQDINSEFGAESGKPVNFILRMFNPSEAVCQKAFTWESSSVQETIGCNYAAGQSRFQSTSAYTQIRFAMTGGDITNGTFKLIGIG